MLSRLARWIELLRHGQGGRGLREAGVLFSAPAAIHWTKPILYALAGTAALAPVALYLAVAKE